MPEKTFEYQLRNINDSNIYLDGCLDNLEFTSKIQLEETQKETLTTLDKFKNLLDIRDADYFERMQARKENAL